MGLGIVFEKRFHKQVLEFGRTHRDMAADLHGVIRRNTGENNYLPSVRLLCRVGGRARMLGR